MAGERNINIEFDWFWMAAAIVIVAYVVTLAWTHNTAVKVCQRVPVEQIRRCVKDAE